MTSFNGAENAYVTPRVHTTTNVDGTTGTNLESLRRSEAKLNANEWIRNIDLIGEDAQITKQISEALSERTAEDALRQKNQNQNLSSAGANGISNPYSQQQQQQQNYNTMGYDQWRQRPMEMSFDQQQQQGMWGYDVNNQGMSGLQYQTQVCRTGQVYPGYHSKCWTCGKCGNINYGHRNVCNLRKCGAPKPVKEEDTFENLTAIINSSNQHRKNLLMKERKDRGINVNDGGNGNNVGSNSNGSSNSHNGNGTNYNNKQGNNNPSWGFEENVNGTNGNNPNGNNSPDSAGNGGNQNGGNNMKYNNGNNQNQNGGRNGNSGNGGNQISGWFCVRCTNFNYENRKTCNMRICGWSRPKNTQILTYSSDQIEALKQKHKHGMNNSSGMNNSGMGGIMYSSSNMMDQSGMNSMYGADMSTMMYSSNNTMFNTTTNAMGLNTTSNNVNGDAENTGNGGGATDAINNASSVSYLLKNDNTVKNTSSVSNENNIAIGSSLPTLPSLNYTSSSSQLPLPLPPTAASPTDTSPVGFGTNGGSSNGFGENLISQCINAQQSSVTPTPLANNQDFNYGNTFNNAIISAFQNQVWNRNSITNILSSTSSFGGVVSGNVNGVNGNGNGVNVNGNNTISTSSNSKDTTSTNNTNNTTNATISTAADTTTNAMAGLTNNMLLPLQSHEVSPTSSDGGSASGFNLPKKGDMSVWKNVLNSILSGASDAPAPSPANNSSLLKSSSMSSSSSTFFGNLSKDIQAIGAASNAQARSSYTGTVGGMSSSSLQQLMGNLLSTTPGPSPVNGDYSTTSFSSQHALGGNQQNNSTPFWGFSANNLYSTNSYSSSYSVNNMTNSSLYNTYSSNSVNNGNNQTFYDAVNTQQVNTQQQPMGTQQQQQPMNN